MNHLKTALRYLLAIAFVLAGINHFLNSQFYMPMMPPFLPAPLFLIYLSGAIEIVLGILFSMLRFSRFAVWGIIALLVAVFPANIYMAMNPQLFPEFSAVALYLRLPLQGILIWLVYFSGNLKMKSR